MVATRAGRADATAHLVTGVDGALADLLTEHPELTDRAMERAAVLGRAGLDGPRRSAAVLPENVVQPAPTASSAWASLLPMWASPCSSANRTTRSCHGRPSAVGLNVSSAIGPDGVVRIVEEAPKDPALGAQRIGDEWVGRDGDPAGLVDVGDRGPSVRYGLIAPLDEQRRGGGPRAS